MQQLIVALVPVMVGATRRVLGPGDSELEDALQESSVGLLRAITSFRSGCSVKHFASRIATFTALRVRRNRRYRHHYTPPSAPEEVEATAAGHGGGDHNLVQERQREAFRQLLDELPEPQAQALTLYTVLGFTVQEIAELEGAGENTIRSRLRLAKQALRAKIEGDPRWRIELGGGE
jgi:RNA polymerase sigma-70 factor (ECF subfamily)